MRAVVGITAAVLIIGASAPVAAQTDERSTTEDAPVTDRPAAEELGRLKDAALAEVDGRIEALEALAEVIDVAEHLTLQHRTMLVVQVDAARVGLRELRSSVSAANTLRELGATIPRIVEDHWVFALMTPKVHEVIAADALVAVSGDLGVAHERIAAVMERAASAGLDVHAATRDLALAQTAAAEARALAAGVPGSVLPITPEQMPDAGSNLVAGAQTLGAAFELLGESVSATRSAVAELRSEVGHADT